MINALITFGIKEQDKYISTILLIKKVLYIWSKERTQNNSSIKRQNSTTDYDELTQQTVTSKLNPQLTVTSTLNPQ